MESREVGHGEYRGGTWRVERWGMESTGVGHGE